MLRRRRETSAEPQQISQAINMDLIINLYVPVIKLRQTFTDLFFFKQEFIYLSGLLEL